MMKRFEETLLWRNRRRWNPGEMGRKNATMPLWMETKMRSTTTTTIQDSKVAQARIQFLSFIWWRNQTMKRGSLAEDANQWNRTRWFGWGSWIKRKEDDEEEDLKTKKNKHKKRSVSRPALNCFWLSSKTVVEWAYYADFISFYSPLTVRRWDDETNFQRMTDFVPLFFVCIGKWEMSYDKRVRFPIGRCSRWTFV